MSYKREYYNQVFESMRKLFGEQWYQSIAEHWWLIWRSQIKKMFDEGILISEIEHSLIEASQVRNWPVNTAMMKRVRDVVLKNRLEVKKTVRIDGPARVGDLFSDFKARHRIPNGN